MGIVNMEPFLQALPYPGIFLDATSRDYTVASTNTAFNNIIDSDENILGKSSLRLFRNNAELVRLSLDMCVHNGKLQSLIDLQLHHTKISPLYGSGKWYVQHSPIVTDGKITGILQTFQPMRQCNVQVCSDQLLTESEKRYDDLFNTTLIPLWIYDVDTLRFLHVNETACRRYGYTPEEYEHMTLRDIRPAEDIPEMERAVANVRDKKQTQLHPYFRHKKKDGTIIYVKIESSPVTFGGRQARLAQATDITDELTAQHELMDVNERLQAASDMAHVGYWTNDLKDKISWSDELYKIFEVSPGSFELTLPNIMSCFHPDDISVFQEDVSSLFSGKEVIEHERRIITPTGKTKWIFERMRLLRDSSGVPARLEGIALDINKRKLDETAIRESNERLTLVMNATVEAVIDWDIANDCVVWGEGFEKIFGYSLDVYDNYLWSRNIHADDKERVLGSLGEAIADKERERYYVEFRFLKSNGEIAYVQHRAIFLRDKDGRALRAIGAMADVTESMQRIHEIQRQNELLREIAWVQSHVVRAPLASLMGMVNLLKDSDEYGLDKAELTDNISELASKLDEVIHTIVRKSEMVKL